MSLVIVCIIFVLTFEINALDDSCSQEGAITNTISITYQCKNGKLIPIGCVTKGGLGIRIGETAPNGNSIIQCQKTADNSVGLIPVGCSINGHDLKPNEEYSDDNYYYGCTSKNGKIALEPKGCIGSSGEKVPIGNVVMKKTYKYKCVGNDTNVQLEPDKCIYNNKDYAVGDVISDGVFWSTCERSGYAMSITLKGCVDDSGKRVNPRDQFKWYQSIYRCEQDGNRMGRTIVACVQIKPDNMTHYVGEKWLEPSSGSSNGAKQPSVVVKYLIECVKVDDKVGTNPVRCYFEGNNFPGTYVDPGCMKKVGRRLLKCASTGDGLQANYVENATNKDQTQAQNDGLKFC